MWQSADPILNTYLDGQINSGVYRPVTLNLYNYTAWNPLNRIDPDGKADGDVRAAERMIRDGTYEPWGNEEVGFLFAGVGIAITAAVAPEFLPFLELGFLATSDVPLVGPIRTPVPRTGPKGVDLNHHNANVTVRDADGNIIKHERVVSGNMTAEEKAMGFPQGSLASHTEARAVSTTTLEEGQSMTITGQQPPCNSCKGKMNKAAKESGAEIKYQWRENGATQTWEANKQGLINA